MRRARMMTGSNLPTDPPKTSEREPGYLDRTLTGFHGKTNFLSPRTGKEQRPAGDVLELD
ncbi:hypothetical protein K2Q16_03240 [Patescibacteria group bacterium]|nr:hypothetical protein [Patescibacteria group bacterium]